MNNDALSEAAQFMLAIVGVDLNIRFYHTHPPMPAIRHVSWDCYGPHTSVDQTELQRYGGKAYYIPGDSLSFILAQSQLLAGIASVLHIHFTKLPWPEDKLALVSMLELITQFAAREIGKLVSGQM